MEQKPKEFKTIKNMISQAIGIRFKEGEFPAVYSQLNHTGAVDDLMRDRLLITIITWIELHEKECLALKK